MVSLPIREKLNWRDPGNGWVQIQDDNGVWFWPDCGYRCLWCARCIGCIRKLFNEDDFEHTYGKCESSEDGLHHTLIEIGDGFELNPNGDPA